MKAFVLILLLAAGVFAWIRHQPGMTPPAIKPEAPVKIDGVIEVTDKNGRGLRCELTGKRGEHLQVRREADQRVFLLKLDALDEASRRRLSKVADFNGPEIEKTALDFARQSTKVELLSVPALSTFRCPLSGKTMTSSQGHELEAFRDFLRSEGVGYRNVTLNVQPVDGVYYLPEGVPEVPCIRVGDRYLSAMDGKALKAALVASYLGDGAR